MLFEGSMVAIVTPFQKGKVDEKALRRLVDLHIESGTSAIIPCGTTGESATLTPDERENVIAIVKDQAKGRVKILAGAGSNSTAEALQRQKFCEEIGVDGALHVTPYYNKPTQEGLYAHFREIAEHSRLPIVLYNVPSRTAVNLLPETVVRLSLFENIVGIKEASGSLVQVSRILQEARTGFGVYSGDDALTYPMYALGAHGVISVTANIVPDEMAAQFQAVQKKDFLKAREIHYQLLSLHEALFLETNPIPVKVALSLMGLIEEEYRLPLVRMGAKQREILKGVLKKLGKIF